MIVDLSTDEDLMYLLQSGDHKALLVLYERHSEKVWSHLQKRVPREDAEDLFQDCFVRLIDKKILMERTTICPLALCFD